MVFIAIIVLLIVLYHVSPIVEQFVKNYAALLTLLGVLLAIFLFFSQEGGKERISRKILETRINASLSPIVGLCLGREKELSGLGKDLKNRNVLLIKGIAGIGKTTLGLKFKDKLEKKGINTFWHQFDSESYEGFLLKLSEHLKALDSPLASYLRDQRIHTKERLKIAVRELCNYSTVLFLDNFQKIGDDSDFKVFKDYLKNSHLVIMSRTQPSFLSDGYESLQPLDRYSSVNLLRKLNSTERLEVLEKIYEKTQGHPWSLVCFAELSRVLPAKNLLEELPNFGKEQQNYVFEQCWKHLNDSEKDFLMRASVFTKPLSFDALKRCSGEKKLLDILISLLEKSYVIKKEENYYTHEIIREFALLNLKNKQGLYIEAQRKVADYYRENLSAENLLLIHYHLKEAGDCKEAIDTIMKNMHYFWQEGFWLDVKKILKKSLDLFKNEKLRAEIYFNLGTVFHMSGEWEDAIEYYEKSLGISKKLGDIHHMALTYNNLGSIYDGKGEHKKAIEYYERNLEILVKCGDFQGVAQTYGNLGLEYYRIGEWEIAIEYFEKDLGISEKVGDIRGMSQTYNNLGLVYAAKGNLDRALEYYRVSLKNSEPGDKHGIALTYGNIGSVYYERREYEEAMKHHMKSLKILEELGDVHNIALTYGNMGLIYAAKGEYGKAIEYYRKDLDILERLGDIHSMAQTYNNLGDTFFAKEEYEQALDCYKKALEMFKQIGAGYEKEIIERNLSATYEKLQK